MKTKSITVLLFLISCISFSNTLTLKTYLNNIKANDPAYAQIFINNETIDGAIQSLSALYDPRISGTIEYTNKEQQPYNFGGTIINLEDNTSLIANVGLSKKFEDTGTNLSVSYLRVANSSRLSTVNINQFNPALTMKISQPLWKDFMGIYTKMPLERLNIQKDIVALSVKEAEENYFLNAINMYYDWTSLTLAMEPLKLSYKNALGLYEEVSAKYLSDAALKTDLLQAENAVLLYRNALNETLHAWNSLAANIYQKMGKQFSFVANWEALPSPPKIEENFCKETPNATLPKLRIISTIENSLKQYELDLAKLERENMPDLSIYGEITKYNNTSDSSDSFLNLKKSEYKAGLLFSTALDRNDIKGQNQSLLANISNTKQELLKTEQSLDVLYKNNLLNLSHLKIIEENTKKIADNSKEVLDIETKRFSQGKTSLFSISDYRQKYTQHKIDHLNKVIAIAKLKTSIASLNDSLLINIKELTKE